MKTGPGSLNKDEQEVVISYEGLRLNGILSIPKNAKGLVIFAHGSGSSRWSSRNNFVARELRKAGLATLLMDLLTPDEENDRAEVFNIESLAQRLIVAKNWLQTQKATRSLLVGYFGASTGAGAALVAAAREPKNIFAVVSRGGRPDLADRELRNVKAPTLLIVGGDDDVVIDLNRQAYSELPSQKKIEIIPGATHLFEEPGTLEQVAALATRWFNNYLISSATTQDFRPSP
ncbi:dienelactone hydrolase family protein [Bdellovibrio sp. ArHS]|uniref:dienelactone hydrolase family protein n=1 Tax=Bdellovibrio sp. ArHS TaxID=1569284 RepID=UPI000B2678A1|nr:dienelactone hydrolase family protein [Bdellovibrio sp. ArHS]